MEAEADMEQKPDRSEFVEREFAEKYERLKEEIGGCVSGGIVVAFSGGVDSALLLKLACMAAGERGNVYAVTVQTKLHPSGDLETAKATAAEFGAAHKVLYIDELAETGIETNPVNRCYLCKKGIFRKIKEFAEEVGAGCILEGTNADDLGQYRPGIQALKELEIISPLAACGLTKAEIRELAAELGISAANRPSAPCLATRLPYGTKLNYDLLSRIDEGECFLRELGFYNVRLRVHELTELVVSGSGDAVKEPACQSAKESRPGKEAGQAERKAVWLARIEVDREDISKLSACAAEVTEKLKRLGFARVTVDLEGFRSGSMDEHLGKFKDNIL